MNSTARLAWIFAAAPLGPAFAQVASNYPSVMTLGEEPTVNENFMQIVVGGVPQAGTPLSLGVQQGPALGAGFLFFGVGVTVAPIPGVNGVSYVGPPVLPLPFTLDANGDSGDILALAALDPALSGVPFVFQASASSAQAPEPQISPAKRIEIGAMPERWFAPDGQFIPTQGPFPRTIHTADIDNDGDLDIVLSYGAGTFVDIYLQDPAGDFVAIPSLTPEISFDEIAVGDLNADGFPEIVLQGKFGDLPRIWWGSPDLSYPFRTTLAGFFVKSAGSPRIRIDDFDGDGFQDLGLLVAGYTEFDAIRGLLLMGDGTGAYDDVLEIPYSELGHGTNLESFEIGDVDNDGDIELVATFGNETIWAYQVDWTTRQLVESVQVFDLGPAFFGAMSYGTHLVDVDQDGNLDYLLPVRPDWFDSELWALRGLGDGTFGDLVEADPRFGWALDGVVDDFNLDGHPDLALGVREEQAEDSSLTLFWGMQGAAWSLPESYTEGAGETAQAELCHSADLDGDGYPELLVNSSNPVGLRIFRKAGP